MHRFSGRLAFTILIGVVAWPLAISSDIPPVERPPSADEFTFARLIYRGGNWRGSTWDTDYPKADLQFLYAVRKLTDLAFVRSTSQAVSLLDERVFEYPFLYAVEVGHMNLTDEETLRLREYLLRGGFLVVDDFHGEYEWQVFFSQIKRVLPEYPVAEIPITDPVFHCFFDIDRLFQVPGLQYLYTGRTWEKGGRRARYLGIRSETGRLMVVINHNVDLGDAWEWAEMDEYPRDYVQLAFQLGVNYIIYSMTR